MKQVRLLLFIPFFVSSIYAEKQAPGTAQEAFRNHIAHAQKFVTTNKSTLQHAAKITGNVAKIGGAIALSVFTYSTGKNLADITEQIRTAAGLKTNFREKWIYPHLVAPGDVNRTFPLPRPSYFIVFPTALYLLYNGSHGIYKEVRTILAEQKESKHSTIIEQETKPENPAATTTEPEIIPVVPNSTDAASIASAEGSSISERENVN